MLLNHDNKINQFQSILATKRLMSRWNKDILLKVNEEEMKEVQKRLESPELFERVITFLSRKNKL